MHFFYWCNHIRRASISSQSEVGVEGGFFTQWLVQSFISWPVAITIVEGSLLEKFFKAHWGLGSSTVVSILVTHLLEGVHSLDTACYHLWDCADAEISAFFDHLTESLCNIFTPALSLFAQITVKFVDLVPCAWEPVCEPVFSHRFDLSLILRVLNGGFILSLSHEVLLVLRQGCSIGDGVGAGLEPGLEIGLCLGVSVSFELQVDAGFGFNFSLGLGLYRGIEFDGDFSDRSDVGSLSGGDQSGTGSKICSKAHFSDLFDFVF